MRGGATVRPSPARTRSESRQRTALVALRLLPNERDKLAEAAYSRGITLSELIRSSALQAVETSSRPIPTEPELAAPRTGCTMPTSVSSSTTICGELPE